MNMNILICLFFQGIIFLNKRSFLSKFADYLN